MTTGPLEDTIVAISTPPGQGGIGIVRLSGSQSLPIAQQIFLVNAERITPARAHRGQVKLDGQIVDDGLLLYFKQGSSYSGEDIVELQLHGSPVILSGVVSACVGLGARLAEAGEFTKRAFMNGKLDLSQAEAVADLIHAQSLAGAALAARQLAGGLAEQVREIRSELVGLLARLEAGINFPDDEIEDMTTNLLKQATRHGMKRIDQLLVGSERGIRLREGVQVAIVGFPNAGKSSLFNALLEYERAIVTPVPGTTRDTLRETVIIGDVPFVLSDTAGITSSENEVEQLGVERSILSVQQADLILLVLDAEQGQSKQDFLDSLQPELVEQLDSKMMILLGNKSDLVDAECDSKVYDLVLSAKTGEGLDQLRSLLTDQISASEIRPQHVLVSNIRHITLLRTARTELDNLLKAIKREMAWDGLYADLEQAIRSLGLISGEDVSEDVVDTVFSQFCVGK